jgi:tetratricopeptide (TPR) repeat protein
VSALTVFAQNQKLAQEYFKNGEYEKAGSIYSQLWKKSPATDHYFTRYLDCLKANDELDKYLQILDEQIKRYPAKMQLYVLKGNYFVSTGNKEKADELYMSAIDQMPANKNEIQRLASAFIKGSQWDLALKAYEKGSELLNDPAAFAYMMADLYRRTGETNSMIDYYLLDLSKVPQRLNTVKTWLQRFLSKEDYKYLQEKTYQMINEYEGMVVYLELLEWIFVTRKDYKAALRQAKALDKQFEENGIRVYNVGRIAENVKEYDTAIQAYEYIINNGDLGNYYFPAQKMLLECKRKKVTDNPNYSQSELADLQFEYKQFFEQRGITPLTAEIIKKWAALEALYLSDLDKAIELLLQVLEIKHLKPQLLGEVKLDLGDYYLIKSDIWEASLLYSQVDKANKEGELGERARFKNAKLFYYSGEFEWAQTQFDILKASTSKMIANDALDLSVFIMDNLNLDTSDQAMRLFATSELLLYQNQYEEAFLRLDSLEKEFPGHSLADDILYVRANVFREQKKYDQAIKAYQEIIEEYPEEIRGDNAIFELATLYDDYMVQPELAKPLYERMMLEYPGSTLTVFSRKRYREIGDMSKEEKFMRGIGIDE